jgi:2-iminobutanoate/2-iminopropanoate deaminase
MPLRKINVADVGRLPAFYHAVVAGDFIYVSGTLGTEGDALTVVPGGTGPETTQTLRNIESILAGCGATLADLVKINVYLADIGKFPEMNAAYLAILGGDPPARITVGGADLALGASVEIDAVAYKPARS